MKVIVLVSGGVDSVTALYQAHHEHEVVAGLSFDYQSKHNHRELPCAAWHCARLGVAHHVVSLGFMGNLFKSALLKSGDAIPEGAYEVENLKQTVVPFRNGIMLSIAAGLAESVEAGGIVIAAHSGDHAIYPDCRESFMQPMADAIAAGTYADVHVLRPFVHRSKGGIVSTGAGLGVDFSRTWSCYQGRARHCGRCGTCVDRLKAFAEAGVVDPVPYEDA